jgi:hypothetical protein
MAYRLRLFEGNTEVSSSTVAYVPGPDANNYPREGQTFDDMWLVLEVISRTESECCVRVKRIKKDVSSKS